MSDSVAYPAISPNVVETIGLDESEFAIWNGLQTVGFSVEVECRKSVPARLPLGCHAYNAWRRCKQKAAVDREDYELSPWIKCPMPGCQFIWCKKCNQEARIERPSCVHRVANERS